MAEQKRDRPLHFRAPSTSFDAPPSLPSLPPTYSSPVAHTMAAVAKESTKRVPVVANQAAKLKDIEKYSEQIFYSPRYSGEWVTSCAQVGREVELVGGAGRVLEAEGDALFGDTLDGSCAATALVGRQCTGYISTEYIKGTWSSAWHWREEWRIQDVEQRRVR